jgi:transposase
VLAEVVGMTDMTISPEPSEDNSYEARRSARKSSASQTLDVRVRPVRRRAWSDEAKLRIVRETLEPGAVALAVAERHGISTGLLFTWRKQMLAMAMSGFTPVEVRHEALPSLPPAPSSDAEAPTATGDLQVVLPGGAEVRFSGSVTPALLREVLAALSGR